MPRASCATCSPSPLAFCLASVLRTFREGARAGRVHAALAATAFAAVAVGMQMLGANEKILELYSQRIDAAAQLFDRAAPAKPTVRPGATSIAGSRRACPRASPSSPRWTTPSISMGGGTASTTSTIPASSARAVVPPAFQGPEAFASYLSFGRHPLHRLRLRAVVARVQAHAVGRAAHRGQTGVLAADAGALRAGLLRHRHRAGGEPSIRVSRRRRSRARSCGTPATP